jgi:hypothetical protein
MADGKVSDDPSLVAADATGATTFPVVDDGANKQMDLDNLIAAIELLGAFQLTSAVTVNSGTSYEIDLSDNRPLIINMTGTCTFTTAGKAAGNARTVILVGHASTDYSVTWPSWKTWATLPTTIPTGKAVRFELLSLGTTDANVFADVKSRYSHGVPLVLSTPTPTTQYKNTQFAPNVSLTGGPSSGYVYVNASVDSGAFFISGTQMGTLMSGSNPSAGDQNTIGSMVNSPHSGGSPSSSPSSSLAITPPTNFIGTVTVTYSVTDGGYFWSDTKSYTCLYYGDTEVHSIASGSSSGQAYGEFYLSTGVGGVYLRWDDDSTTLQGKLNTAFGANAPSITGGGSGSGSIQISWNGGSQAGIDVTEPTASNGGSPYYPNDGSQSYASLMKTQEADGSTITDIWTLTYNGGYDGWTIISGQLIPISAGSPTIGSITVSGVTYGISGSGGTITLSGPDYTNYGSNLSLTDTKIGTTLSPSVTTTTPGG